MLTLCQDIVNKTNNTTTRAAAQNVAANTVSCLGKWLCKTDTDRGVEDVIPVMQFLCTKIEDGFSNGSDKGDKKGKVEREMLLCCLDTCVKSLNKKVTKSENFCTFIWRSLCPAVIKLLVRGSGHSIVCSLTSLMGHMESHRLVLEATYHRMLIQTPQEKRLNSLKAISKLLSEKRGLLDLCWLQTDTEDKSATNTNDMAMIIM